MDNDVANLIAKHQPVDRGDLALYADQDGVEIADLDAEFDRLLAAGKVTIDGDGDVRLAPGRRSGQRRPRGLSPEQLAIYRRWRANRAREIERDALADFRDRHLGGELLAGRDAVPAWIERHREPLADYSKRKDGDLVEIAFDGGAGSVVYAETRPGGVVDELRILSERLAAAYRWQPADAVSFVLCDYSPPIAGIRVAVTRRWGIVNSDDVVVVESHPHNDATDLQAAVQRVKVREGLDQRRPELRQAELADFMLARRSGNEARIAWRRHCREIGHPEWSYKDASSFSAAVKRARELFPDAA